MSKLLAVVVMLLGGAWLVIGIVATVFAVTPGSGGSGAELGEALAFVLAGALWLWLSRRLWKHTGEEEEARYVKWALLVTLLAWLASGVTLVCWALLLSALALASLALRAQSGGRARLLPTPVLLLLSLLAAFALPLWNRHGGIPGSKAERAHGHAVWQISHLH